MTTKVVYKYRLTIGTTQLALPEGAHVLDVRTQDGQPHFWLLHEQDAPPGRTPREFVTFATGQPIDEPGLVYVGTCHGVAGNLVFHVFERVLIDGIAR